MMIIVMRSVQHSALSIPAHSQNHGIVSWNMAILNIFLQRLPLFRILLVSYLSTILPLKKKTQLQTFIWALYFLLLKKIPFSSQQNLSAAIIIIDAFSHHRQMSPHSLFFGPAVPFTILAKTFSGIAYPTSPFHVKNK